MRQTIHLFIGDEMASVAEAVSSHLSQHGNLQILEDAKIVTWQSEEEQVSVRCLSFDTIGKKTITSDAEGTAFFGLLHSKVVIAGKATTPELYLCVYGQLYKEDTVIQVAKIATWAKNCGHSYRVDVYGLAHDVAHLFCVGRAEEEALITRKQEIADICKGSITKLIEMEHTDDPEIERCLILQNTNQQGYGLNLDKTTLIRILGEYALLTTEQFDEVFPTSNINRPDVTAFGISGLWFNRNFFTSYLLSRSYIYVLEREKVDQHETVDPNRLLKKANEYVNPFVSVLSDFYVDFILPNTTTEKERKEIKTEMVDSFQAILEKMNKHFLSILDDPSLSLPEKRAMFALLLWEDDELTDECVLMDDLPCLDDCLEESVRLYVEEHNKMGGDSWSFCLPELKGLKADIRRSEAFVRDGNKRLKEIEQKLEFEDDCKKKLTPEGFVVGEEVFKLQHDVVERPLAADYEPKKTTVKSVDLRPDFSSIRNQGAIGSCTAFSSTSIFEFILNKADKERLHTLSPRFLYYNVCKKNADGTPIDNGSSFYDVVASMGNQGICEERYCKYSDDFREAPTQEAKEDASTRLLTEAKNVKVNHEDIISALAEGYPVAISLKVFDSLLQGRKGFVFRPTEAELSGTDYGWHAMTICGFLSQQKVYIVRNSWGTQFGDKGYCYIPFSYIEDPDLCRQACIFTGVSCNEIVPAELTESIVTFDSSSKDTEYAILRILIEEERINLNSLKERYAHILSDYIKLLSQLSNKGTRNEIMLHAIGGKATPSPEEKEIEETKDVPRFGVEKWIPAIASFIIAIGLYISQDKDLLWPAIVLTIGIVISTIMMYSKKTITEKKNITVEPAVDSLDSEIALKMKFLAAGMVIDRIRDIKDEIEAKHRLLTNYVSHLETWLKSEKISIQKIEDDVRDPFLSILDESDFVRFFDSAKDDIVDDIWLYKMFEDYNTEEKTIRGFQNSIRDLVKKKLSAFDGDFTMFKFLTGVGGYKFDYSTPEQHAKWLKQMECLSTPFVQGVPSAAARRVLTVRSDNQNDWKTYCQTVYNHMPECSENHYSSLKATFFQIQEMKSEEVKSLR